MDDDSLSCLLAEIITLDQDQNVQNHEPDKIEVIEEKPRESTENRIFPIEELPEWVMLIRDRLDESYGNELALLLQNLCIYKVPYYFKEWDRSYLPQMVSIGPCHHGRKGLQNMEPHKLRAVNTVLRRTNQNIESYIYAMEEIEAKVRACYEDEFPMSSNDFTVMLVFDGCFVLELFRGTMEGFHEIGYARNDPVFAFRGSMIYFQHDMLKLNNQLPFFVLNRLYEVQLSTQNPTGSVAELAVHFFKPLMPTSNAMTKSDQSKCVAESFRGEDCELHCLDIFRRSLLLTRSKPYPTTRRRRSFQASHYSRVTEKGQHQMLLYCATKLSYAGITFRKRKTGQFWEIKFRNRCLEIPKLSIHDGTRSVFANLIAYEQCHVILENIITSYIVFMKNLINSHEDVIYLQNCGIIEHWLGSETEVATLFTVLCAEVVFDPVSSYLGEVSDEVNHYYKRNAYKAKLRIKYLNTLKERYFNNPWAYFTFVAAVLLLVLTFTQTFFTVYAYYKPPF